MPGVMSVAKHSGLKPPPREYALLPPHDRPFFMVSLGQAHGFPMALYAAIEPAIIKAMTAASASASLALF